MLSPFPTAAAAPKALLEVLQKLELFQTTPQKPSHILQATLQSLELSKHLLGKEQVTNSNIISSRAGCFSLQDLLGFTFTSSLPLAPVCCARMCPDVSLPRLVICDFSSDKTFWQLLAGSEMPL